MALLQFMLSGMSTTAVPTSIHCDHLIAAHEGADRDVAQSIITNKEIFDFLESGAKKYGIAFWKPGSGIIHQIVLENYAAPGGLMLGTDSHTPNAGKLSSNKKRKVILIPYRWSRYGCYWSRRSRCS
jgi:homoaconitase